MSTPQKSITFTCFFDVIGRQNNHSWKCAFDVVSDDNVKYTLHTNNQIIQNPTDIDMLRYCPRPLTGVLQNKEKTYVNTKIEFLSMNQINSSFGNVVSEVCYTDKGGRYTSYITPGLYNIDIFVNNQKITKRNITIKNGLKFEYFLEVKGLIYKKYKDTVSFCGSDYKMIYGQLIDNKKTPVDKSEMIILDKNKKLVTYVKTDDDGRYKFALKNGEYIVKIRAKDSPIKSTNVILDDLHGFQEQLGMSSILFGKQSMIYL